MGGDAQTDVTNKLNAMLTSGGKSGIYKGGKGVIVRAVNDGLTSTVVPATLMVNDIISPSTMYPDGNPMCPNQGWSGWNSASKCSDDPFDRATVGAVIGTNLPKLFTNGADIQSDDWGYGVFYGSDANAADQRCRWVEKYKGYDCPGGWIPWEGTFEGNSAKVGAGGYASGNPTAGGGGGGAGCHFSIYDHGIDQFDAVSGDGKNLVQNQWCECNYALKTNWWQDWVKQWQNYGKAKPGYEWMGWFGKGKAPTFGMDITACWVNNPRDMIMIQNALWWLKDQWNNLLMPESTPFNAKNVANQRHYWGWNEIPLDKSKLEDTKNWDAIIIKLPPAACGNDGTDDQISCLSINGQQHLEDALWWYVNNGYLLPGLENIGKRPGSYVVFMKEWYTGDYMTWERGFFCNAWTSPSKSFKVIFEPISGSDKTGKCYASMPPSPTPPPPPPPPPPPSPPGPVAGNTVVWAYNFGKCIDIAGGDLTNGNAVQIWDCNGLGTNQNWVQEGGQIKNGANQKKCLDAGSAQYGSQLQIWDCNGLPQQRFSYMDRWDFNGQHVGFLLVQGKCVHIPNGDAKNGNPLELHACHCFYRHFNCHDPKSCGECYGALWSPPSTKQSGITSNFSQLITV